MYGVDDGEAFTAHVEPGAGRRAGRVARPDAVHDAGRGRGRHRRARGHLAPVGPAATGAPYSGYEFVPRARARARTPRRPARPAGMWAFEALRIARGEPRLGLDTDHRTIPNEVGWIGTAVHLDKGCYRGQETVARVHTLGRPPRRLTLLHLDGSDNRLPERGQRPRCSARRSVGFVGTSARHHELGPIALAHGQAQRPARRGARGRRSGRRPGGRGRPRGRPARAPVPSMSWGLPARRGSCSSSTRCCSRVALFSPDVRAARASAVAPARHAAGLGSGSRRTSSRFARLEVRDERRDHRAGHVPGLASSAPAGRGGTGRPPASSSPSRWSSRRDCSSPTGRPPSATWSRTPPVH